MAVILSNCGWIVTLFSQFQLWTVWVLGGTVPREIFQKAVFWWARIWGQGALRRDEGLHKWVILPQVWNDLKPVKSSWNSSICQRPFFIDLMCIIHPKLLPLVVKSGVKSLHFSEDYMHGCAFCAFWGKDRKKIWKGLSGVRNSVQCYESILFCK